MILSTYSENHMYLIFFTSEKNLNFFFFSICLSRLHHTGEKLALSCLSMLEICLLLGKMKCRVSILLVSCKLVLVAILSTEHFSIHLLHFPQYLFAQQLCYSNTACHEDLLCLAALSCPPGW